MAGYVRKGEPLIYSGLVDETDGLPSGKFVVIDLTDDGVTLATKTSATNTLYFTVDVNKMNGVGSDVDVVRDKGEFIAMALPTQGQELCFNMAGMSAVALGTALYIDDAGVVKTSATTDGPAAFAVLIGKDDYLGSDAIQVRIL